MPTPARSAISFISAWARQASSYSGEDVFSGYAQAIESAGLEPSPTGRESASIVRS